MHSKPSNAENCVFFVRILPCFLMSECHKTEEFAKFMAVIIILSKFKGYVTGNFIRFHYFPRDGELLLSTRAPQILQ